MLPAWLLVLSLVPAEHTQQTKRRPHTDGAAPSAVAASAGQAKDQYQLGMRITCAQTCIQPMQQQRALWYSVGCTLPSCAVYIQKLLCVRYKGKGLCAVC